MVILMPAMWQPRFTGFGKSLWLYLLLGCAVICGALAGLHFALRFDPTPDGRRLGRPVMSLDGGMCCGKLVIESPAEMSQ